MTSLSATCRFNWPAVAANQSITGTVELEPGRPVEFAGFELTDDDVAPSGVLAPVRLFGKPVALSSSGTADAAGKWISLDHLT